MNDQTDTTSGTLDIQDRQGTLGMQGTQGDGAAGNDPRAGRLAAAMSRIIARFGSLKAVEEVYATIADELADLLPYERLVISQFYPELQRFEFVYERAVDPRPSQIGVLIPTEGAIAGQVIADRRSMLYTLGPEDRYLGDPMRRERGIKQLVVAPIIIDEQPYGALAVSSIDETRYQPCDLWLIESLAGLIGMLVSGVRLRHEAQRKASEAELLAETARLLATAQDLDRVSRMAVKRVSEALACACALFLRTDAGDLDLAAVAAPEATGESRARYIAATLAAYGTPLATWAHDLGTTTRAPDDMAAPDDEEDVGGIREQLGDQGVEDMVVLPIRAGDEVLGALLTIRLSGPASPTATAKRFTSAERDRCRRLVHQIAPALLRARLHASLTRALHESETLRRIGHELARTRDTGALLHLIARSTYSLFAADYVGVMRFAPETSVRWEVVVGNRTDAHIRAGSRLHLSKMGRLLRAGEHQVIHAFPTDASLGGDEHPFLPEEGIRACLALPIMTAGMVLGGLVIGVRTARTFRQADVRFAQALAMSAATALHPATDPMGPV